MAVTLDDITLPEDIVWVDEFLWPKVAQTVDYTLTGSLIIQAAARSAGRPITLRAGDEPDWVPRSTVVALRAKADVPGLVMTLNLRGQVFQVIFRHPDGLEVEPVLWKAEPGSADWYKITINLMTV